MPTHTHTHTGMGDGCTHTVCYQMENPDDLPAAHEARACTAASPSIFRCSGQFPVHPVSTSRCHGSCFTHARTSPWQPEPQINAKATNTRGGGLPRGCRPPNTGPRSAVPSLRFPTVTLPNATSPFRHVTGVECHGGVGGGTLHLRAAPTTPRLRRPLTQQQHPRLRGPREHKVVLGFKAATCQEEREQPGQRGCGGGLF